jgi:glycerol-3-phosphate cytidylyltransferase
MKQYNVGLIAGSFDLVHPGYIWMFKDAKTVCDKLIIALQGDPTIDRPHKCKPVQSIEDRIEILSAIRYVDEIVIYNTEAELLHLLQNTPFDVRILGSDYVGKPFTGDVLNKPIHFHHRNHAYSLTDLKEKIYQERKTAKGQG